MRLLVTDGTFKHTLGIVRHLGRHHEVYVGAERRIAAACLSRFAHRTLTYPAPAHAEAFVAWVDRTVRLHGIDQIIPVGPATGELLAHHQQRWLPQACVVIASAEQMALALDKPAVGRVAEKIGVSVPRTGQPGSLADVESVGYEVGYPLVIKPPVEGIKGVAYVDEPAMLRSTFDAYLRRHSWSSARLPILQQRIVGPGFGVFATYQHGQCRRVVAHRRVRELPASGGQSTCAELFVDPVLIELGQRVLDALAWHGVAMVEFKQHLADGKYYLMEINPKFWGSLDLDLASGSDFTADLLAIGAGQTLAFAPPPERNMRFCWPLYGDLRHLIERPRAWRAVFGDWFSPAVRTNVQWNDPLPHLVEFGLTCRWLIRR